MSDFSGTDEQHAFNREDKITGALLSIDNDVLILCVIDVHSTVLQCAGLDQINRRLIIHVCHAPCLCTLMAILMQEQMGGHDCYVRIAP